MSEPSFQKLEPILKEVYEEQLVEQLRWSAKVYGNFKRTPEEEARIAERQRERERERKELLDLLATAPDILKPIIELHSPTACEYFQYFPECEGCDYGGYEGDKPSWPCRTIELIAERLRNE